MSETIRIVVNVDDAKALSALGNIEAITKKLNAAPVTIKVDAGAISQINGLTNSVQTLAGTVRQTKFSVFGGSDESGNIAKIRKEVKTYNDELGRTVEITKKINAKGQETFTTKTSADYAKQARYLQSTVEATTRLDTRLANLSNSVKSAADSGKYAKGIFDGLSEEIGGAKERLGALSRDFTGGKITAEEFAQGVDKIATESGNLTNKFANLKGEIKETSGLTKLLGEDFAKIAAKQAAWQLLGAAVAGVSRSLKEALATMKEVDSELATVRKVTGMSAAETKALGEQAYSTASKYGVEANEYLESVGTFARAGYKEAAQELGELAIKTQLVGDTTAQMASQFLLSTDAAWKYKGDIEALSLVLDAANEIDNKYATSIQKIAEGMPIVANVASMAGMTAEETMAALGTITATTQESGTKAATALRALILNILGDTTTEIEDGVTATEESVKTLSGILNKYAADAVKAAKASGELINPLEAIRALSEAYQNGDLTQSDLYTIVESLGGKLRTNQLEALLQNYDMLVSMMQDMKNAAGSADDELAIMLDTWERKTNILKNTWTEFVSHLIDTEAVKVGIDALTGAVELLDTGLGRTIITVTALTAAAAALKTAWGWLKATEFAKEFVSLLSSITALKAGISSLTATMLANPLFAVAAGAGAIIALVANAKDANEIFAEQKSIYEGLNEEYKASQAELSELEARTKTLTEAEQKRLEVLKAIKATAESSRDDTYKSLVVAAGLLDFSGGLDANGNWIDNAGPSQAERTLEGIRGKIEAVNAAYKEGSISEKDYLKDLSEIFKSMKGNAEEFLKLKEDGQDLSESVEEYLEVYEDLAGVIADTTDATDDNIDAQYDEADALYAVSDAAQDAAGAVEAYKQKLEGLTDFSENADFIVSAFKKAQEQIDSGLVNTPEIKAIIDSIVPTEVQRAYDYETSAIWEHIQNGPIGRVLSAEHYTSAFFDELLRLRNEGASDGIVRWDGDTIKGITSSEDLAKLLGSNKSWAEQMTNALYESQDNNFFFDDEAAAAWEQAAERMKLSTAELTEGLTQGKISFEELSKSVKDVTGAGTEGDLADYFEGLLTALDIELPSEVKEKLWDSFAEAFGNDTGELSDKAKKSAQQAIDAAKAEIGGEKAELEIDANGKPAEKEADKIRKGIESKAAEIPLTTGEAPASGEAAAQTSETVQKTSVTANTEDAKKKIESFKAALKGIPAKTEVSVSADGAGKARSLVSALTQALYAVPRYVPIAVTVTGNALSVLNQIIQKLQQLQNMGGANIPVNADGGGAGKKAAGGIPALADGKSGYPGGYVLVNDGAPVNGSPQELIVDSKGAYIANGGKPAVTKLEKGAVVYTAEETADILAGDTREYLPALSSGITRPTTPGKGSGSRGGSSRARKSSGGGETKTPGELLLEQANDLLQNLDKQIELARNRNDKVLEQELQDEAVSIVKEYVEKMLKKGLKANDNEVLDLLNKGYGYSDDLMNELVESLQALTDATDKANSLAEKQKAVDDAKEALENVKKQRTVRVFNPATGQWEWVANGEDIESAEKDLEDAEKALRDEQINQELEAIKKAGIGDIEELMLGKGITSLISGATEEEQQRIADILKAITGGVEASTDTSGKSIFTSTDSHDTVYQFGEITLTEEQAGKMTVKQLADLIKELKLT